MEAAGIAHPMLQLLHGTDVIHLLHLRKASTGQLGRP
jgi:hypothetical protein